MMMQVLALLAREVGLWVGIVLVEYNHPVSPYSSTRVLSLAYSKRQPALSLGYPVVSCLQLPIFKV